MDLGANYTCLNVVDLEASIDFYLKLDFKMVKDRRHEKWCVLQHNNLALSLYQGHIVETLINFRGGDIAAIHKEATDRGLNFEKPAVHHPDGAWNATIRDPDGNCIFFNTFPDEREEYIEKGRLIDF